MLAIFALATFGACQQEDIFISNTEGGGKVLSNFPDFQNKNGVIYFQNIDDAQQAYRVIQELVADSHEGDPIYGKIVDELGHNSLYFAESRVSSRNDDDDDDEYTQAEIMAMDEYDHINDEVRKLLLNEHHEVGLGNDVIVFYAESMELRIENSDAAKIDEFRTLPKRRDNTLPITRMGRKVKVMPSESLFFHSSDPFTPDATDVDGDGTVDSRSAVYTLNLYVDNVDCSPTERIIGGILFGQDLNTNAYYEPSTSYTVDFGDGSPVATFVESGPWDLTHDYPSSGEYTVVVTTIFNDEFGIPAGLPGTIAHDTGGSCSDLDITISEWKTDNDEEQAVTTRTWFKDDLWGTAIGAKTSCYYWKASKAKWKKYRNADIEVAIEGTLRNSECGGAEYKQEDKDCNNCHDRKAKKNPLFSHYDISNGDVIGDHRAEFEDGTVFTSNITLNPCN